MFKTIFGVLVGFLGMVSFCFAGDTLNFGESQTAVGSGDVEDFQIYDLDGDGKADIVYKNTSGNVKYSLQDSVTSSSEIPTEGLVAYYPFNGNANDESGNGNNGTVNGATLTTDRFGNTNNAYSFDGVDDYIEINNNDTLDLTNDGTWAAWINISTDEFEQPGFIISKSGWINPRYLWDLYVDPEGDWDASGTLGFRISNDGNADTVSMLASSEIIPRESWHFVVASLNSSNKSLILFIDGVEVSSMDFEGNIPQNNINVVIGRRAEIEVYKDYFNGSIDDVRIYNRALSKSEIQALYNEEE